MKLNPHSEWAKLFDAIAAELQVTPTAEFEEAWTSVGAKTAFYGRFFSRVAEHLGHKLWTEFLRCDFVISSPADVPIAFVESENAHTSATEEVRKFCAVSAPIKILLLSCDWSDSERLIWSPGWRKLIATQHTYFGTDCIYVIMVGEWGRGHPDDGQLRYLFDVIDHRGVEIERKEVEVPNTGAANRRGLDG